jgi:hypothetical protein
LSAASNDDLVTDNGLLNAVLLILLCIKNRSNDDANQHPNDHAHGDITFQEKQAKRHTKSSSQRDS